MAAIDKAPQGHERIETSNLLMIVLILLAVAVGGMVEIVPLFFQRSTTQPVEKVKITAPRPAAVFRAGSITVAPIPSSAATSYSASTAGSGPSTASSSVTPSSCSAPPPPRKRESASASPSPPSTWCCSYSSASHPAWCSSS